MKYIKYICNQNEIYTKFFFKKGANEIVCAINKMYEDNVINIK